MSFVDRYKSVTAVNNRTNNKLKRRTYHADHVIEPAALLEVEQVVVAPQNVGIAVVNVNQIAKMHTYRHTDVKSD